MNSLPELSTIRVIPYGCYSADFNMAADEYLLTQSYPVLRLYGWKRPTLSFGRSNCSPVELNSAFCDRMKIDKVRRKSGGKTVLHHQELTYSFACDTECFPSSIMETYRFISQALADCFKTYGLQPEMKPAKKSTPDTSICFKEVSAYEITINKKKAVGSAQYRRRKRFLQHGSILLDIDWHLWKSIWNIPSESNQLESRITSLKSELGYTPAAEEFSLKLMNSFANIFNARADIKDLDSQEREAINSLSKTYQWTGF
ncbi:lipoate--protein ligase family protein [bacterium]|nr:lipoate--protein ligase family protein [bacterium]